MNLQKVHIAYFCPSKSWGGLEMNQRRNAVWMQERGWKVSVIVQKGSKACQNAKKEGVDTIIVDQHRKYYDVKNTFRLTKQLKEYQITHLIVRDPKDMNICAMAKTFSQNKIFLAYFMEMQVGIPKKDWIHTVRFNKFDLWSCPLSWLENQVHQQTRFPKDKTVVIPSGLALEKFLEPVDPCTAKVSIGLNPKREYIGLVGRFDKQKQQLLLLQAFLKIKDKIEHDIVFLGESTHGESQNYLNQLKTFVHENKLEDRVHFKPFRSDVETFYKAIDVFVMATVSETFGMVTVEAMATGSKVVGSNRGGTVELLGDGDFGYLFDAKNSSSLANQLVAAISDTDFDKNSVMKETKRFDAQEVCKKVEHSLEIR